MAPWFAAVLRFVSVFQLAGASRRSLYTLEDFVQAVETRDQLF